MTAGIRRTQVHSRWWTVLVLGAVLSLWFMPTAGAQEHDASVELADVEHTAVDGRHVMVIVLNNRSQETVDTTGVISINDVGGLVLQRIELTTGPMLPGASNVVAVPLAEPLPEGRYTLVMALEIDPGEPPLQLGSQTFRVGRGAPPQVANGGDEEPASQRGFPSWLMLAGGMVLIVLGLGLRHENEVRRKRRIPKVASVRKVQVKRSPPKRPARIKQLLPPGRREKD